LCSSTVSETVGSLDISGPVNAITYRFTATEKYGEGPKPFVNAEDLRKVVDFTHVIGAAVGLSLLV
jgi:hypothetical protein